MTRASFDSDLHDAVCAVQMTLSAHGLIRAPRSSRWLAHLPAPEAGPARKLDDAKAARFAARLADRRHMGTPVPCSGASSRWTTFRVDDRILRVFADPDVAVCERIAGLSELCGPWGPSEVEFDAEGRWLTEKAHPGETLTVAWVTLTAREKRRLADQIVDATQVLAAGGTDVCEVSRSYDLNVRRAAAKLSGVATHTVAELLAAGGTWRHGDIHSENVLVRNGSLAALLDWEHAIVGHPALDAARLNVVLAAQTSSKFAARICGDLDPALVCLAVGVVFGSNFSDTRPYASAIHERMSELCSRAVETLAPSHHLEAVADAGPSLLPGLLDALSAPVLAV